MRFWSKYSKDVLICFYASWVIMPHQVICNWFDYGEPNPWSGLYVHIFVTPFFNIIPDISSLFGNDFMLDYTY